jgi:uncharacterized protein YjbJ (UPF0337 family)
MDENRIEGTARKYGGRVQEGVGSVTGDTKTRVEGAMNEAAGAAQQLYGQTSDMARQTATTLDTWLRNAIETQLEVETGSKEDLAIQRTEGWILGCSPTITNQ